MKTIIHYYRFDISNSAEKEKYEALKTELTSKGLKLFDSISSDHSKFYKEQIAPLNGENIELETEHLFNNQWNTAPTKTSEKGLRVFDWSEAIYPNRKIKEGMYLDQNQEMAEIRQNTYKCGYCGKNYYKPTVSFCTCCLGSEHLKETDLNLLFLMPIFSESSRANVIVSDSLINEYNERQKTARSKRLEAKKKQKLDSLKADIAKAEKEYKAFDWLIKHDIDFDNVIYYSHTDKFSFGWHTPIDKKEAEKLSRKLHLEGFATYYNFEIKTA